MGRENRRDRRSRQHQRQPEVAPLGQIEFPGVMGWMQKNARWMFLVGITVMILSVGAGAFAGGVGTPDPSETPDDATPAPTSTAAASATPAEEVINRVYSAPPAVALEEGVDYRAVIHLESGPVTIDLLEEEAPVHANNFIFLANNRFFDGLTFHRVIPNFVAMPGEEPTLMAQGGDPLGNSAGGPGYVLPSERNDRRLVAGSLAMAQGSQGVSGSQFFILTGAAPHLDGTFTVFGEVVDGLERIAALTPRDPSQPNQPRGDVILRVEIIEE
ncbi:MAG: peptidylprolyl isomerase [Chloroflexi bacterium]|nr:peptidylprolyl isomerase [Chloroflexota bacterium]